MKRIVWIDWAKTIGIMIVVFCHVPQYNTLEKHFLFTMQMPLFFMLSGYLHKVPNAFNDSIKKYWKTLIIPYLLFQLIFVPYFLVREYFDGQNLSDYYHFILLPILKCFLGTPLDGPTWFLYALLIMKMLADCAIRSYFRYIIIFLFCLVSIFISSLFNSDDITNISFTIDSMFDFLPFFFLGYFIKNAHNNFFSISDGENIIINILRAILLLVASLLILVYQPQGYVYNRLVFYSVGILGSFVVIDICKCFTPKYFIEVLSKGTIVILGLHWMFIGFFNILFEKFLHIGHGILYSTFQTVIIVSFITFVNYFIIIFCKKNFNIILGGRK